MTELREVTAYRVDRPLVLAHQEPPIVHTIERVWACSRLDLYKSHARALSRRHDRSSRGVTIALLALRELLDTHLCD